MIFVDAFFDELMKLSVDDGEGSQGLEMGTAKHRLLINPKTLTDTKAVEKAEPVAPVKKILPHGTTPPAPKGTKQLKSPMPSDPYKR